LDLLPPAIQQIAVAIEALHKASLVHDDIEDRDAYRYGRPTIHHEHGIEIAINVGDYLVGLGYRLIAMQAGELGGECVADILQRLSAAHLRLCCGQGTELMWNREHDDALRPVHALQIGALKTAPAFEVALYAGLRAAGASFPEATLKQFAVYVGEGYQVLNDLENWEEDGSNKQSLGRDFIAGRPTILQAFALEAGGTEPLAALAHEGHLQEDPSVVIGRVRDLYEQLGAFEKSELLYNRLRQRALELAGDMGDPALQELLRFLVRNVLRKRVPDPHRRKHP
jgi:geranylgeranyl pyrophosphate synthase